MSGPDFAGLLKEHKEKEAKAVLRAVGGDLGSVSTESSRDGKNIKHFWCHIWGAVLILGVLRYLKEYFLANLRRFLFFSAYFSKAKYHTRRMVDNKI